MARQVKIALLGHSYIKYLGDFNNGKPYRVKGAQRKAVVKKFFKPGAKIREFQNTQQFEQLKTFKPDLTYLFIGGNDITKKMKTSKVVSWICKLIENVEKETDGQVKFVKIEPRLRSKGLEGPAYNKMRTRLLNKIKYKKEFFRGRLCHLPFKMENLKGDGVHPNRKGTELLNITLKHMITNFVKNFK